LPPRRIVTLTTDFGLVDTFVGRMKGVALGICPDVEIVDLTHEVPAHDVEAAGYLLWTAYTAFPPGTIHVAVVDPGVGTERKGLAVRTEHHVFIAPDNGLLTRVLEEEPPGAVHFLEATHYFRGEPSATFHGRDIFAPVAAWIARGTDLAHLGPEATEWVRLPRRPLDLAPGRPSPVRVLHVDRFGNATLDVARNILEPALARSAGRLSVQTLAGPVSELRRTYGDGSGPGPFLLFNSSGHLEVALREGRAADALGLEPGLDVLLILEA
jgi:S-adenosyl-L-methionine hydrolase (adenosine-forming)